MAEQSFGMPRVPKLFDVTIIPHSRVSLCAVSINCDALVWNQAKIKSKKSLLKQ